MLSLRGLEPFTCPEESYRMGVSECDHEASILGGLGSLGNVAPWKKIALEENYFVS